MTWRASRCKGENNHNDTCDNREGGEETYCVSSDIVLVLYDEYHVKTGEDGRHKVNILKVGKKRGKHRYNVALIS